MPTPLTLIRKYHDTCTVTTFLSKSLTLRFEVRGLYMDRFFTLEELQKEYCFPPQLLLKLRAELPTAYYDEDGTTYYLESNVDAFLARWANGEATPSPYFTTREAAAYLRTTEQGIYSLVKRGKLTSAPGRRTLTFTREALDDCLVSRRS